MLVNNEDTNKDTREEHLKRLEQLSIKTVGAVPWLEEPSYDQKRWLVFRLTHSNTWPKFHENKIGDYNNWK